MKLKMTTVQVILLGFLCMILFGTFLLMLPVATKGAHGASFFDALFTATSAACVTGLSVQDTATYWSMFGKIVIILLIQVGGMGVITVVVAITMLMGKKIGLAQRKIMQESISADKLGGIIGFTSNIIKVVFVIELLGAVLLFPVFYKEHGILSGIGYSLFHSVSAFCNAGFDLMGYHEKFSSLTYYNSNVLLNIVIVMLILVGGIGFGTWKDIWHNKWHLKKYSLQSKLVLCASVVLLVIPFIYYYFGEYTWLSGKERVLAAVFQTVTPRTAGFNTQDLTKLSDSGIVVMIMLMLTGGASGSTAGGMKITTIAVLVCMAVSVVRHHKDASAFGRRIHMESIKNAATVMILYNMLFVLAAVVISKIEALPMLTCMFETSSAIATVGLTLGITPGLGMVSKVILILLMFLGRVGGLTIFFAAFADKKTHMGRFPEESVSVG